MKHIQCWIYVKLNFTGRESLSGFTGSSRAYIRSTNLVLSVCCSSTKDPFTLLLNHCCNPPGSSTCELPPWALKQFHQPIYRQRPANGSELVLLAHAVSRINANLTRLRLHYEEVPHRIRIKPIALELRKTTISAQFLTYAQ